jgi:glutathione synthase/RimK-type ligase-like ATP-grasp enzyme
MILCLYGRTTAPFVEPVVADLQRAAAHRGKRVEAVTIEEAVRERQRWEEVERLYVLPFDPPLDAPRELPIAAASLVRTLFPRAAVANSVAAHEQCWDKLAAARRLLDRGVPMPESLITSAPEEAAAFVREVGHAILKEPRSCGGHGHVILFPGDDGQIVGETFGRRYLVELEAAGIGRKLDLGILHVPPPFFLQRLMANAGRGGLLLPAQILRAYIVDGQVLFWTERYRDRIRRPSDFVISVALGARYRFLPAVSEEAKKAALRAAEAFDVRIGVVDLLHAGERTYVLEVDTDGPHMMIDRSFKRIPDFRPPYDFDDYIAESLIAEPVAPERRSRQEPGTGERSAFPTKNTKRAKRDRRD